MKFTEIEYDQVRAWITKKRGNAKKAASWEELFLACKNDESQLQELCLCLR